MATMHIHNKYEVTFDELVEKTKEKGGRPKEISVDPDEGWQIMIEMGERGSANSRFKLVFPDHKKLQPYQAIFQRGDPMPRSVANELLQQWWKKEWWVEFENIPLKIVPKKKPDVPNPKPITPEQIEEQYTNPAEPVMPPNDDAPPWWMFWK